MSAARPAQQRDFLGSVVALRKLARESVGFMAVLASGSSVLLGTFRSSDAGLEQGALLLAWLLIFVSRVSVRLRREQLAQAVPFRSDLELGLLMLVFVEGLIQAFGGVTGALYPIVYVFLAFVGALTQRRATYALLAATLLFDTALYFGTEGHSSLGPFVEHVIFGSSFALMSLFFTRAELAQVRERSNQERKQEVKAIKEQAQLFRLLSLPTTSSAPDEERMIRSSVEEVRQSLFHLLSIYQRTLNLHTCAVLLIEDGGETLRLAEIVTQSDAIHRGPFSIGEGAIGAVVNRGLMMNLEHVRPGYKGICYYREAVPVRAFVGIPIRSGNDLVGVLCADRLHDEPFAVQDENILEEALPHILRSIRNEQVIVQLERSKVEQGLLYRASQALGAAITEDAVMEAGLAAAKEIAAFDFAAITSYDSSRRKHIIRRAVGTDAPRLQLTSFADNASLVGMAVRNRHYLPYRGDFDAAQQVIFTKTANLKDAKSALVLPLIVRENPMGTLVLAANRTGAFPTAARQTLQVLANQLASALANAAAVKRLEELATIDGLTGCLNKRAFNEEFEKRLKSAERFKHNLTLIVTDIDHFKSVNDTYGHATGDVVIRRLGELLRESKRETDVVARFGGEEFCILCEETDTEGALLLAERIREELAATVFPTEKGRLQVTCSLGVASFPKNAKTQQALFEASDQALYAAKRSGRNKVCKAG